MRVLKKRECKTNELFLRCLQEQNSQMGKKQGGLGLWEMGTPWMVQGVGHPWGATYSEDKGSGPWVMRNEWKSHISAPSSKMKFLEIHRSLFFPRDLQVENGLEGPCLTQMARGRCSWRGTEKSSSVGGGRRLEGGVDV
jgi:hypothetical protein